MHEPIKVDVPSFFPHKCCTCQSATGPLVDTHVETVGNLHVYVCASCVAAFARTLGMAAGDEQADLLHAREHETQLEKQVKKLAAQRVKLLDEAKARDATLGELDMALEQKSGRIAQLEAAIAAKATADLAMVTP